MQRRKRNAATWLFAVMPAIIFGVGCFVDYALSSAVHGPNVERIFPAVAGLTVGTVTVLTAAKRRDAYIAAAAIFSAVAVIAITLAAPVAIRVALCSCCLLAVAASLGAYALAPAPGFVGARSDSRDTRPRR